MSNPDSESLSPVCDKCPARCCTSRRWIFTLLRLFPWEAERDPLRQHVIWRTDPELKREVPFISLRPACPFLGGDNRCRIYEVRPEACRQYVCHRAPDVEEHLRKYPTHHRLLRRWGVAPGQQETGP